MNQLPFLPHLPRLPNLRPQLTPSVLRDALAGLSVAAILLPQAVAYSAIAGAPILHALVATLLGLALYAALGSSRFGIASPTSSAAAVFASTAIAYGPGSGFALVMLTGALLLLTAWMRADFLAAFVSRPVLRGFSWALSATIIVSQLPQMTGVNLLSRHAPDLLLQWFKNLHQVHMPTLLLGGGAFATWLLLEQLQKRHPWLQPSLVVMLLALLLSALLPLQNHGIALLGHIDLQGIRLQWPDMGWHNWEEMAPIAPTLLLIVFAESWGAVHSLALPYGDKVSARRDMAALGIINLACGLLQGLPAGVGFSASSANHNAGGRSRLAGVFAGFVIVLLLWLARSWLALLPMPALAAIVAGILSHNLSPRPLFRSLRLGGDAWLALLTAAGVFLSGVLFGMLMAAGLSMLMALRRFAKPRWSELGHLPETREYLATSHSPQVQRVPHVMVMRPEAPLFFANAETILQEMAQHLASLPAPIHAVILSLETSDDLDSTTLEALDEFQKKLHQNHQHLLLARIKDRPRQSLQRAGRVLREATAPEDVACARSTDGIFTVCWSVDNAMQAAQILLQSDLAQQNTPPPH